MRILSKSWDDVTQSTIANCWTHAKICPKETDKWEDLFVDPNAPDTDGETNDGETNVGLDANGDVVMEPDVPLSTPTSESQAATDSHAAWDVVLQFATTSMTYPAADRGLKAVLREDYIPGEWKAALDAMMDAEEDAVVAEAAVRALMPDFSALPISNTSLPSPIAHNRHLKEAEKAFSDIVQKLRDERCIRGEEASIDELLNPLIEQDFDSEFLHFADGDAGEHQILEYL
ncbi:hypothetical protein K438DRAFT_2092882 [Mycena galopus ATCC 62051]|nr:hypothetical protein K438DRAFT_2092882 [Mycena galopus ATCC 62051]